MSNDKNSQDAGSHGAQRERTSALLLAVGRQVKPCFEFIFEVDKVLRLSIQGIDRTSRMVPLVEALKEAEYIISPKQKGMSVEEAKKIAELAKAECENDFPMLHAHSVVAIWSALEATIPRMATQWLIHRPTVLKGAPFAKITFPVSTYETLSVEARATLIVEELLRSLRTVQPGITRFEALMKAIELGGGIPRKMRRDLFEMYPVRNVIVHQFGVVDDRLIKLCPWIAQPVGERLKVSTQDYLRYREAATNYLTELTWRIAEATGQKRPEVQKQKPRAK